MCDCDIKPRKRGGGESAGKQEFARVLVGEIQIKTYEQKSIATVLPLARAPAQHSC